jgi:ribosomal protein S18 acetylase RimI-like enzyme
VSDVELASRIQASIQVAACHGRDCERTGPFLSTFDREDDNPFLNYAIPDAGATPTRREVRALAAAYRERSRRPRLEFLASLAPDVEPVLLAEGFEVEGRLPLMIRAETSGDALEAIDGIELVSPSSEHDYRAAASVQWEAYEGGGDLPERVPAGLRRTAETGGLVVLARDARTHEPAGAGLCTRAHEGYTELASVGVRPMFRRRGIAAAMADWLAREALRQRVTCVFLMARGEAETRIYVRAGFATKSDVLHISRS